MKLYSVQRVREIGEELFRKGFTAWAEDTAQYLLEKYSPNEDCFYRMNCVLQFLEERERRVF